MSLTHWKLAICFLKFDRHKIIILHQKGHCQREISKEIGYSRCGIQAVIKKFEESGEDFERNGQENIQNLMRSFSEFLLSSKDLARHLATSSGCKVDPSAVRRSYTLYCIEKCISAIATIIAD